MRLSVARLWDGGGWRAAVFLGVGLAAACPRDVSAAPSAREVFAKHCAQCHGKDGHGFTPMGKQLRIKDLTASKLGDAEIRSQIMEGAKDKKGIVRMAPFKDKLSADEVEQLVAFVKGLRQ
ncbi:MAG: cytochrome c [Verrucomicrobiae bacterium]|nr:cytochrome c [Verrucomicrobiae bacterium]